MIIQYVKALVVSLTIFTILSFYLFLRRGYYDLYIVNKVFAGTSIVMLGIVLLMGSLSRLYDRFDGWLKYRKELGIVAFFYVILHVISSFSFLPHKFPLSFFINNPIPSYLGFASLIILVFLFFISFEYMEEKLGNSLWWFLQNWGIRIGGVLAFLHVLIMKYPGWVKWFKQGGSPDLARPFLPPASFLAGWFFGFVICVRLAEFLGVKKAQKIVVFLTILFLISLELFFVWGLTI